MTKVVAVVPAYNEEKCLGGVLVKVRKYVDEVLVSDDGSADRTATIAKKNGAHVISSPVNMGVGHATRLGCEYAIEKMKADVVVLIDADGQHPPEQIPKLLERMKGGCEFVFTSRFGDSKQMPLVKKVGNASLTFFTNLLAGVNITDSQSGFRAFTSNAYKKLDMRTDGYELCSEFAIEVGRNHIKYCEVPIESIYDDWTKVKGVSIFTGVRILANILWLSVFGGKNVS